MHAFSPTNLSTYAPEMDHSDRSSSDDFPNSLDEAEIERLIHEGMDAIHEVAPNLLEEAMKEFKGRCKSTFIYWFVLSLLLLAAGMGLGATIASMLAMAMDPSS